MYLNKSIPLTERAYNLLEKEKESFGKNENEPNIKLSCINKLLCYLSFNYSDYTLPNYFAEAILLISSSQYPILKNDNAQEILYRMFSFVEKNFHNAYIGMDGDDIEMIFDHKPDNGLALRHNELDIKEAIETLYPATKKYIILTNKMSFEEKLNLTRIAFLFNQFLFDRKIQHLLSNRISDFRKLKEKIVKK